MSKEKVKDCIIIIFGASGDLSLNKLIPSIFNLYLNGFLSEKKYAVLAISRSIFKNSEFKIKVKKNLISLYPNALDKIHSFLKYIFYEPLDLEKFSSYKILNNKLSELRAIYKIRNNLLFYFSISPALYSKVSYYMGCSGLNEQKDGYKRIAIEKPFGFDWKSALDLNNHLLKYYKPSQIFRVDHYLGKKMVRNLLAFRMLNKKFEPIWNRNFIKNVKIFANETSGLGARGSYYDTNGGAIKDMIQSHLLQLLAVIAMDKPAKFNSYSVQEEFLKVIKSIKLFKSLEDVKNNVILAQYEDGVFQKKKLKAYRREYNIPSNSLTETFALIRLNIENGRWGKVPFFLQTGKRLSQKIVQIQVNFNVNILEKYHIPNLDPQIRTNKLIINIYPKSNFEINLLTKSGEKTIELTNLFNIKNSLKEYLYKDYDFLISNIIEGNHNMFVTIDQVLACWNIVDPIFLFIKDFRQEILKFYPCGSDTLCLQI